MKSLFSNMSLNHKLALIAIALGFVGLFAGSPYRGSKAGIDAKELALIVGKELDHVKADELADWIIQNRSDFRLLDLRGEKEFTEYHIPNSENVELASLEHYPLQRNEKIVLYSEGGIHSAQAWFLLRAKGFKGVYILSGGLDEWNDKILFPKIPEKPTADQLKTFGRMKEISKLFGGSPQIGTEEPKPTAMKVVPKPGAKTQIQQKDKKKKEGC
jgi:rhodanese-related sulfurtransferase